MTAPKIVNWTLEAPGYFTKPVVLRNKTLVVGMVRDLLENGVAISIKPNYASQKDSDSK